MDNDGGLSTSPEDLRAAIDTLQRVAARARELEQHPHLLALVARILGDMPAAEREIAARRLP